MPKNGSKNELFGYFWARILKHCFHVCNLHYQICLTENFRKKTQKSLNFVPNMTCFVNFALEFYDTIFIFQFRKLKFVDLQKLMIK